MTDTAAAAQPLAILVVDSDGKPVVGARLEFRHNGALVGKVISGGESSIQTEVWDELQVTAVVGDRRFSARAEFGERELTLVIPSSLAKTLRKPTGPPTARCPDGTSGQPCVTCRINGQDYFVCG
jgi:hypothetical protein